MRGQNPEQTATVISPELPGLCTEVGLWRDDAQLQSSAIYTNHSSLRYGLQDRIVALKECLALPHLGTNGHRPA